MSLASWRSPLARALHRNRSLAASRYLQLATIRADGRPANRTVVFRGFALGTDWLQFVTDTRSQKVEQLTATAWAEACWYFSKTREQFRLAGKTQLVNAAQPNQAWQEYRQLLWQQLSDAARQQFTWPSPSAPRDLHTPFPEVAVSREQPLENFCLLLLQPTTVEHLELRGNPQNRWLYEFRVEPGDPAGSWFCQMTNP